MLQLHDLKSKLNSSRYTYLLSIFKYSIIAAFFLSLLFLQIKNGQKKWGIYHYYLGSKYIKELGYFDLYTCSLKASPQTFANGKNIYIRELHSYRFVPTSELPPCPVQNFTQSRWNEFKNDLEYLTYGRTTDYWSEVISDKGFNPPPFWTTIAGIVAHIYPLRNSAVSFVLFNSDFIFIFLSAFFIWYAAGLPLALLTVLLVLAYPGTFGAISNSYLQFIWYPFIVISIIAWRKSKFVTSGISLGLASALQSFPLIFALPIFSYFVISLVKKNKNDTRKASQFLVSFFLTFLLCIVVSTVYIGRVTIWPEWYTKITTHRNYIKGEIFNIGFENFVGTMLLKNDSNSRKYFDNYSSTHVRNNVLKQYSPFVYLIEFIFFAFIVYSQWKLQTKYIYLYGYLLIYLFLTLSPYYYLTLALLPFAVVNESLAMRRYVIYGLVILYIFKIGLISFDYQANMLSKTLFFVFYALLFVFLLRKHPHHEA